MAMGTERSKPLHNFSMPRLKWGSQRFLKCVKLSTESVRGFNENENEQQEDDPLFDDSNDIDAVREKLMIDLRVAADKLKVSIFDEGNPNQTPTRPWNLRTRRASCTNNNNLFLHHSLAEPVVVPNDNNDNNNKKKQKKNTNEIPKFSVSLSKEEVEQDFWALVGTKPPRRPKKRPRIVQKQLDVSNTTTKYFIIFLNCSEKKISFFFKFSGFVPVFFVDNFSWIVAD